MSDTKNVELSVDLALVSAICDGTNVKVNINNQYEDVECACYLYYKNKVISKSGYRKNRHHQFDVEHCQDLKCKVFFRSKTNPEVKITKFYDVIVNKPIKDAISYNKYKVNNNISNSIDAKQCEIVSSKTNTIDLYEKRGFKPRTDCMPYPLYLPVDWLEDPFNDRNWMFQLHGWRMLDPYFVRAQKDDLGYIADIINDWVQFEKNNTSKWLWYDMSTGLRALKITLYLKLCYDKQISHGIDDIDYLLHEHFRHLSNPKELNPGNHGLFQLHGLKSLTYIIEDVSSDAFSMTDLKKYANEQMSKLITSQLGTNGVHTEDSPDYHFFAYNKIKNIVGSLWWGDLDEGVTNTLKLADYAKSWLVSPDNRCVAIGDSTTGVRKNLPDLENWSHLKKGDYISAFVGGYAIIRSLPSIELKRSSFLFFQGSFHSQAHKHCDDLSFILQEKGINILIDSGKYGYQQDKYRRYFLSTRAHNTIEVDGTSTARNAKYAYGSALLSSPKVIDGFWIIRGRVNHELNKYSHERIVFYKPGEDLYVLDILNNYSKKKSRSVNQWWHFDTDSFLNVSDQKVLYKCKNHEDIEITSSSSSGSVIYSTYKGYEENDRLVGWVSKKYLKFEPTPALSISTTLDKKTVMLTRFNFNVGLKVSSEIFNLEGKVYSNKSKLNEYLVKLQSS